MVRTTADQCVKIALKKVENTDQLVVPLAEPINEANDHPVNDTAPAAPLETPRMVFQEFVSV